jgi:uncharacterized membrane protein
MQAFLLRLHRFVASQSFYPIVLSSTLAVAIYLVRVAYSGSWIVYANLIWNLFLAWIPYVFSMLAAALHSLFSRKWWLMVFPAAIWLLFFPNAPYIVTDFFHLVPRYKVPMWYDILLLTTFSWTGIFLTIASLRTMQGLVKFYLGGVISWLFVVFSLGLGGLGIYLGRFERWNSWDMLTHPKKILKDVLIPFSDPLNSARFFGFTILFTSFLVVCYLMFISMRTPGIAEKE